MKPFQAVYYICHNPLKVITVFIMIALTGLLYVGGCYVFNLEAEYLNVIESESDVAYVNLNYLAEEQGKEDFIKEVKDDENMRLYAVGVNNFLFPTVFTFSNGSDAFSYSVSDFLSRNERHGWVKDTSLVKDNTLFLTERYARYLDLEEGDLLEERIEELTLYYGEYPYQVHIMEGDTFGALLVEEDSVSNEFYQLTWSGEDGRESFQKRLDELKKKYKELTIVTYEERIENTRETFAINDIIFWGILVVTVCVFFITINAVLVGIYDKRKKEFEIYESIGIPMSRLRRKIIAELVIMSGVGMVLGILLSFATITLLNSLIFEKDGLQLYYYHKEALGAWLICNIMILIPSIFLRLRAVEKRSTNPK